MVLEIQGVPIGPLRSIVELKRGLVPKGGVEPPRPCGHMVLNHARLPFRHFGTVVKLENYSIRNADLSIKLNRERWAFLQSSVDSAL